MRITSGRLKGRPLHAPEGLAVRPTSDKVRQAIFNVLEHRDLGTEFALEGARVIDLFAGTGALGIEAISRGGRYALFVDNSPASRAALHRNVETMGLTGISKIWRRDAAGLGRNTGELFDLAFLDPPYRQNLVVPALKSLREGDWLKADAIAVAETSDDEDIPSTDGYVLIDQRDYGETRIVFLRLV
jgi:16S rRNA (guanine966-N2)-methyltransferase